MILLDSGWMVKLEHKGAELAGFTVLFMVASLTDYSYAHARLVTVVINRWITTYYMVTIMINLMLFLPDEGHSLFTVVRDDYLTFLLPIANTLHNFYPN